MHAFLCDHTGSVAPLLPEGQHPTEMLWTTWHLMKHFQMAFLFPLNSKISYFIKIKLIKLYLYVAMYFCVFNSHSFFSFFSSVKCYKSQYFFFLSFFLFLVNNKISAIVWTRLIYLRRQNLVWRIDLGLKQKSIGKVFLLPDFSSLMAVFEH